MGGLQVIFNCPKPSLDFRGGGVLLRPVTLILCLLALLILLVPGYARASYSGTVVHAPSTYPANIRNAARAARLVNCQVIFPGQVFSFNAAVGPRTVANGFIPGKTIINGNSVYTDVGSGICRTASAFYSPLSSSSSSSSSSSP
ncbi:MAG: VanW family protein [Bacillota bacterium]